MVVGVGVNPIHPVADRAQQAEPFLGFPGPVNDPPVPGGSPLLNAMPVPEPPDIEKVGGGDAGDPRVPCPQDGAVQLDVPTWRSGVAVVGGCSGSMSRSMSAGSAGDPSRAAKS